MPVRNPILATAAARFLTKRRPPATLARSVLKQVSGVSPGLGGFVAGMAQSADANAPVLDVTQTADYQRLAEAVRAGAGGRADMRNWNPTTSMLPPTHAESLAAYDAQQQQTDAMFVRAGKPVPKDQRLLARFNQYNPRAYAGPR